MFMVRFTIVFDLAEAMGSDYIVRRRARLWGRRTEAGNVGHFRCLVDLHQLVYMIAHVGLTTGLSESRSEKKCSECPY